MNKTDGSMLVFEKWPDSNMFKSSGNHYWAETTVGKRGDVERTKNPARYWEVIFGKSHRRLAEEDPIRSSQQQKLGLPLGASMILCSLKASLSLFPSTPSCQCHYSLSEHDGVHLWFPAAVIMSGSPVTTSVREWPDPPDERPHFLRPPCSHTNTRTLIQRDESCSHSTISHQQDNICSLLLIFFHTW